MGSILIGGSNFGELRSTSSSNRTTISELKNTTDIKFVALQNEIITLGKEIIAMRTDLKWIRDTMENYQKINVMYDLYNIDPPNKYIPIAQTIELKLEEYK